MQKQIRQTGFTYSIGIAINRVVPAWLFRFRVFTIYQLDPEKTSHASTSSSNLPTDAFEVSLAETPADLRTVERLTYFQLSDMDTDVQAVQAKIDGQLAGAVWAARRGFDEADLGLRIELSPGQCWLFAALVDKSFRRRGVYSRVIGYMVNHLHHQGAQQQMLSINPFNIASVRAHEKYFSVTLAKLIAVRFLGVAFCFRLSGSAMLSSWVSWRSRSRPILVRL